MLVVHAKQQSVGDTACTSSGSFVEETFAYRQCMNVKGAEGSVLSALTPLVPFPVAHCRGAHSLSNASEANSELASGLTFGRQEHTLNRVTLLPFCPIGMLAWFDFGAALQTRCGST